LIWEGEMRSFKIVLMLLVVSIACSPLSLTPGSTPLPTQEPAPTSAQEPVSTPTLTPGPRQSDGVTLTDTQEVVDKMKALCCEDGWWNRLSEAEHKFREAEENGEELDTGAVFLESLEAAGERFDANEYFSVLTHLAPEDGYVLDYVYFAPGGDGAPYLYARRGDEPGFATYSAYQEASAESYLSHIQVDGTAEGYYELAVLSIMGGQFYLAWHFGYNDWEVVGSQERVEEIIEMLNEEYSPLTKEQVEGALQLDVTPSVTFEGNKVRVQVLVFTKWGGFYERVFTIDRDFPHQMFDNDIELIPYDCGMMY
jgi:hypothetical protein